MKKKEFCNLCMNEITIEQQIEELKKENEKLKDELSDCAMSNQLLDREYNRLKDALSKISFRTNALCRYTDEMKRVLVDIDKICKLVWDGEESFRIKETGIYKLRNGKKAFVNCLNEKDKEVSGVIEGIFDDFYWNEDGTIKSEINYYTEDEKEFDIVGK